MRSDTTRLQKFKTATSSRFEESPSINFRASERLQQRIRANFRDS